MATVTELQFIISSKATVLCCKLVELFEGPRSIHWSLQRSASYPSQLALSELSEEAWNQIFPTSLTGDVTKMPRMTGNEAAPRWFLNRNLHTARSSLYLVLSLRKRSTFRDATGTSAEIPY